MTHALIAVTLGVMLTAGCGHRSSSKKNQRSAATDAAAGGHQQEQRDRHQQEQRDRREERERPPVYSSSPDVALVRVQSPPLVPATQPLETIPPQPEPGAVWIAGHYNYTGTSYAWEPGRWETPPPGTSAWVPPSFQPQGSDYVYVRGHWQ